jgi:hypothetical protein
MGNEANCRVEVDGESAEAKVLLETEELIVRGAMKLRIPFRDVQSVDAADGVLRIRWSGREARLSVGAQAAKWAEKIRNPKSVIDKLGVKAGQRVSVVGSLDPEFLAELSARTSDISHTPRNDSDLIFLAAEERAELGRMAKLKKNLAPAGALWVIRPKAAETISEADVLAAGKDAGLVDVKVVRFSARLTAEKFVIPVSKR